jgi:hypothetical protein
MKNKQNKWEYLFVIQGNYGYGWDDLDYHENRKEARDNLKKYRENEPKHQHRIILRRERK